MRAWHISDSDPAYKLDQALILNSYSRLEKADKHYYCAHPFTYKQEWLNSDFECEQNRRVSIQKMDLRDKNIVEIIAKVIEEGKDK